MIRLLKFIGALLVILVLAFVIFAFFFHTQIESQITKQVAERSEGKLRFSETDLSFFSSFPNLSCRLTDMQIQGVAQAEYLDLNIGLMSAFKRKPIIKNAILRNATIELVKDDNGWNYQNLFNTKQEKSTSYGQIELQNTMLENITVKMVDNGKLWGMGHIQDAKIDLKMDKGLTELAMLGNIYVSEEPNDSAIVHNDIDLHLKHYMNDNENYAEIYDSNIDEVIFLNGIYDLGPTGNNTDMNVRLDDLELENILGYIPKPYQQKILDNDLAGEAKGSLVWKNQILSTNDLELQVGGEELVIHGSYDRRQRKFSNVRLRGDISGSLLSLMSTDSMVVEGRGRIVLNTLQVDEWIIEKNKGDQIPLVFEGEFDDLGVRFGAASWLAIEDGNVSYMDSKVKFDGVELALDRSSLIINGGMNTTTGKDVSINVESRFLDVAEIWKTAYASGLLGGGDTQAEKPVFDIEGKITADIEKVVFEDITMDDIKGDVKLGYEEIKFLSTGKAFSGDIEMDGLLDLYSGIHFESEITTKGIDLNECLIQCKDFGQAFVTSENLKGTVNSVGLYNFYWDDTYNYLDDQTSVMLSARIADGELNDLDMMKNFSTFIKTKDLERIKFTSLQNYLEIDGADLYIPTMFIQSNAANLTMNGIHSIDHRILYNLQVNAGQVLMNKLKKHDRNLKPQPAQKGWFNMYYRISGRTDAFEYERNKRLVQASFERELLRKERIYQALLDRFGYMEELKPPSDWSSIPEYDLN